MTESSPASDAPVVAAPVAPPPQKPSNMTRGNITGKVPLMPVKHRGRARGGRKVKAAKLSSDQKKHVGQLKKSGLISDRAASQHGLR